MKVFLLQDVAKVGRRHETKEVADGFGRNVLIPQGKAVLVDARNQGRIQELLTVDKTNHEALDQRAKLIKEKLPGVRVLIKTKANDKGHLFAAIKATEIAALLSEQGIPVKPEEVVLAEPLRTIGQHEITWRLGQVSQKFNLEVGAA